MQTPATISLSSISHLLLTLYDDRQHDQIPTCRPGSYRRCHEHHKPVAKKPVRPPSAAPLEAYYEDKSKNYFVLAKGDYISLNESSYKRWLREAGFSDYRDHGLSQIDLELIRVQRDLRIAYAGPLVGYMKGLHVINGRNFLVMDSPTLIEPEPGEWPIIEQLLLGMFCHDDIDQRPYFYGWLKRRLEALYRHERLPGQALVLAGPRGCGKSFTQSQIITPLLGGRSANPYKWMSSDTGFNGDCGAAEHLQIDDEAAKFDHRSRHNFGAQIKQITVGSTQRVEGKHQNAFSAPLIQGLTISLNDEPENLHVLPPMDESLVDKMILLKVGKATMPMPTSTPKEMEKFRNAIQAEFPRLLHFLQGFEVPAELVHGRYGIMYFQHPDLLSAVQELEPWVQMLELLDILLDGEKEPREMTSVDLNTRLLDRDANPYGASAASKLLYFNNACGTYLKHIADHRPERVKFRKTNRGKVWLLYPPEPHIMDKMEKATC